MREDQAALAAAATLLLHAGTVVAKWTSMTVASLSQASQKPEQRRLSACARAAASQRGEAMAAQHVSKRGKRPADANKAAQPVVAHLFLARRAPANNKRLARNG